MKLFTTTAAVLVAAPSTSTYPGTVLRSEEPHVALPICAVRDGELLTVVIRLAVSDEVVYHDSRSVSRRAEHIHISRDSSLGVLVQIVHRITLRAQIRPRRIATGISVFTVADVVKGILELLSSAV